MTNSLKSRTFLVFIIGYCIIITFGACSKQNAYTPSQALEDSINSPQINYQHCNNTNDSLYVHIESAKIDIENLDTLSALKKFGDATRFIIEDINLNLISKYFLSQSKILEDKTDLAEQAFTFLNGTHNLSDHTLELYSFCLKFLDDNKHDLLALNDELIAFVPRENTEQLGKLYLNKSLLFKNDFKLEEALDNTELALKIVDPNSIDYGRCLDSKMSIYYAMQETTSFREAAQEAFEFYSNCEKCEEELEFFLFNYCIILLNDTQYDRLEIIESIDTYGELNNSNLVAFRFNHLCALWNFTMYFDEDAKEHYKKAINISNKQSSKISDVEWFDIRAQAILNAIYLEDNELSLKIIEEVKNKLGDLDSPDIFRNLPAMQAIEYEFFIRKQLVKNSNNPEEILELLDYINKFLDNKDLYNLIKEPENLNYIHQIHKAVYNYKFQLIIELHKLFPQGDYEKVAFFENEKLKAKNHYFHKISNSKKEYKRLLDLIKKELNSRKKNYMKNKANEISNQLILDTLMREFPAYYNVYHITANKFADDVINYCKTANVDILEYYSGNNYSIGFSVSGQGIQMHELEDGIPNYFQELSTTTSNFDSLNQILYNQCYAPFKKNLHSDNLVVISDGAVDNISFESFKEDQKYLVEKKVISYAYSIKSILRNDLNAKFKFEESSIITFAYSDAETLKNRKNHELAESFNECKKIEKMFPQQVEFVSGLNATKKYFLEEALNYDIIHLAMHGDGIENSIRNNKLFFSAGNEIEYLSMEDLQSIFKINSELLVLNTCESNNGKGIVNEGNISLARKFGNLGVKNIITSTFPVKDKSSSELIVEFYKAASNDMTWTRALQHAKLNYLNNYRNSQKSHPIYWSNLKLYFS